MWINKLKEMHPDKKITCYVIKNGTETKLNENDLYQIGSQTKMFTTFLIWKLVENNKINFSDEINLFLDEKINSRLRNIKGIDFSKSTVESLVSHSSGIPDYINILDENSISISDEKVIKIFKDNYSEKDFDFDVLVDIIEKHQNIYKNFDLDNPLQSYSNTGFYLLGIIIEKIFGKTYKEVCKEEIFDKLDMNNSSFDDNVKGTFKGEPDTFSNSMYFSAGQIVSNAIDMKIWIEAIKNKDSRLLSLETFNQWYEKASDPKFSLYGFGFICMLNYLYGFSGQTFGYTSITFFESTSDNLYIISINDSNVSAFSLMGLILE